MKRKIMKLGPATLVVSLPSKWAKERKINQGDEVEMEEQNTGLIIRTDKGYNLARETLDISKYNNMMRRIYASRYLKGDDEIEVIFNTADKSRLIQKRTDDLIGMEIIEQAKDRILVKDMSNATSDSFDSIVKRVFFLLNSLSDESLKAIENKETDLEYLQDIEKNMNKFTDYCFRILNKQGHSDYKKTAVLYCILFMIEEIGDEYKMAISFLQKNNMRLGKEYIRIYGEINDYIKNLQRLFLKFSFEDAIKIGESRDRIITSLNKQLNNPKTKNKEIILLKHYETITENAVKIMGQLLNIN